jgi:alpha-L-arabinofuranosidase
MQWRTDLIGYDALSSYGSPAYYAQKMFSNYRGDVALPVTAQGAPARTWQPPAGRGRGGPAAPGAPRAQPATPPPPPPPQELPTLFYSATRDAKTGTIFLKIVNPADAPQAVRISIGGVASVAPKGQVVAMAANTPEDTNSIAEPTKIVPMASGADGFGTSFTRTFPPYSITVLQMDAK